MRRPKAKTKTYKQAGKTKKLNAAYREAVKEIAEERVEEIKAMVRETLNAIRSKEETCQRYREEIKSFRADLEDLKRGRIEAIRARRKGKFGILTSPIDPAKIESLFVTTSNANALPLALNSSSSFWSSTVSDASGTVS